jgi:uncharacterized membrane protein HdeD (DUF308 family)
MYSGLAHDPGFVGFLAFWGTLALIVGVMELGSYLSERAEDRRDARRERGQW